MSDIKLFRTGKTKITERVGKSVALEPEIWKSKLVITQTLNAHYH